MKYRELKSDERRFFDDNGYLVVREALDEEMLQRVVEAADRLVGAIQGAIQKLGDAEPVSAMWLLSRIHLFHF